MQTRRIVIFISGKGTNARNIISYFSSSKCVKITGVFSTISNPNMKDFCENQTIDYFECLQKPINDDVYIQYCSTKKADFIVLAGFLKKIPIALIEQFPNRIINIHPSLLPKFGGKGMYGMHVHKAVLEANEKESGITIHFVNEDFDKGEHIAQFATTISKEETVDSLTAKIHELEMKHFPQVIENVLLNRLLQ